MNTCCEVVASLSPGRWVSLPEDSRVVSPLQVDNRWGNHHH